MPQYSMNNRIPLSQREQEIIILISNELSSREIAERLFISFETVKSHRKNILAKLEVKNVAGMIREAFLQGIIVVNYNPMISDRINRIAYNVN